MNEYKGAIGVKKKQSIKTVIPKLGDNFAGVMERWKKVENSENQYDIAAPKIRISQY